MKCILPYANCVYRLANKDCSDGIERPDKKEAKCYRVSGKKKMLIRARGESTSELYEPLYVQAVRSRFENYSVLRVFVGEKCVTILKYRGGVWYLNDVDMGNNELDAVERTLKHLGYK